MVQELKVLNDRDVSGDHSFVIGLEDEFSGIFEVRGGLRREVHPCDGGTDGIFRAFMNDPLHDGARPEVVLVWTDATVGRSKLKKRGYPAVAPTLLRAMPKRLLHYRIETVRARGCLAVKPIDSAS